MEAIHIMRPGTHTAAEGTVTTFSSADLDACAKIYDPTRHEAPIVVGHPQNDAPAYGWVERLETRKDGLYAIAKQVNAEFADVIRQGAYKKVSGSFYGPNAPNSPTPGKWYLRHVGFLGAAAPAIKGLRATSFSDPDGCSTFEESPHNLREYRLQQRERELTISENASFLASIKKSGVVPVGLHEEVSSFMETLSEAEIFSFSDIGADEPTPGSQAQWFKKFLKLLPTPVVLGELAGTHNYADGDAEFSAPENYSVNPESAKLHRLALAYQRKNNTSYADAVKAVMAQGLAD